VRTPDYVSFLSRIKAVTASPNGVLELRTQTPAKDLLWNEVVRQLRKSIQKEHEVSGFGSGKFSSERGHVFHPFRYWKQRLLNNLTEIRFTPFVKSQDAKAVRTEPKTLIAIAVGKFRIEVRPGGGHPSSRRTDNQEKKR
jgi:hypothetical protein